MPIMPYQYIQQIDLPPVSVNYPVTWEMLCEKSPELDAIKSDAHRLLKDPKDRVFWERYESLKRRMKSCVGFYAHPGLPDYMLTCEAYDLAYKEIFGRLV